MQPNITYSALLADCERRDLKAERAASSAYKASEAANIAKAEAEHAALALDTIVSDFKDLAVDKLGKNAATNLMAQIADSLITAAEERVVATAKASAEAEHIAGLKETIARVTAFTARQVCMKLEQHPDRPLAVNHHFAPPPVNNSPLPVDVKVSQ